LRPSPRDMMAVSRQNNQSILSATSCIILASSSVALLLWGTLQRRARRKAFELASLAHRLVKEGSLVDCSDVHVRAKILYAAVDRATRFWFPSSDSRPSPLKSQVGGLSDHKRRVLTADPDFCLKPLHVDERGFREIAFYESLRLAHHNESSLAKRLQIEHGDLPALDELAFACDSNRSQKHSNSNLRLTSCMWDDFAMQLFVQDEVVQGLDSNTRNAWGELRDEVDLLRRLSSFTPDYYGIIGQPTSTSYEITSESYLLLGNLTVNFKKPCVMDLKMGRKTYERDAHYTKKERECLKYEQQAEFGFRIVGMRFYDPAHVDADEEGFVFLDKHFGRSLASTDEVVDAFRTFFKTRNTPENEQRLAEALENNKSVFEINELKKQWRICKDEYRTEIITDLIEQLQCIQTWFEDNDRYCFRSSSLLFVYEGDMSQVNRDVSVVKMIDFTHVQRRKAIDEGYLHGVHNVLSMFEKLIRDEDS